jgi:hypothetical protein
MQQAKTHYEQECFKINGNYAQLKEDYNKLGINFENLAKMNLHLKEEHSNLEKKQSQLN